MEPIRIVMGFDYGARRIGIAVGNAMSNSARGVGVAGNGDSGPDWTCIDALMREWQPDALLVGLPLTLDGGEQPNSRAARAFAEALAARYARRIELIDERHSSQEAAQRFAARRATGSARRKHAALLDALAAEIIVERWLAHG